MARQRAFTKEELLDATKELLLERGYEGFHLKGLSETLSGARSTIYEYYANKEEIVAACMLRVLNQMMASYEGVEQLPSMDAIKRTLHIFLENAGFHQLMLKAPKVDVSASAHAARDIELLERGHNELKGKLMIVFQRAQNEGLVRKDIPLPIIVSVFFHAIETPNWMGLPVEQWTEQLFSLWWTGVSAPNLTQ